jgi:hypothetical protein
MDDVDDEGGISKPNETENNPLTPKATPSS